MKKMKRLFWLLPLLLTMLVTGCLKDDPNDETIVLMGTESEVQPIQKVIPDTMLVFVDSLKLNLPTGNVPPDIQGEFVFSPLDLYKYNGNPVVPSPEDTLFLRLGGELDSLAVTTTVTLHAGEMLDTLVLQADTTIQVEGMHYFYPNGQHNGSVPCELYGDVMEKDNKYNLKKTDAFVMGYGSDFTLYFTIDYDCEYMDGTGVKVADYKMTRGYVITGSMTSEGIDQAIVACVNKKVEVQGSPTLVPSDAIESMQDRIYIYRVHGTPSSPFGMAVRHSWVKP